VSVSMYWRDGGVGEGKTYVCELMPLT
jgi:hypothetical protein